MPQTDTHPETLELELHRRLLAGEADASYDVYARYLSPLLQRLRTRFGSGPAARELEDLAQETVTRYILQPSRYHPGGKSVAEFLYMDAAGDTLNRLGGKQPVLQSELPFDTESVAEEPSERNSWQSVLGEVPGLPDHITLEELRLRVRTVLPDPRDQEFLNIWVSGETGFESYVALLDLHQLDRAAQQDAVSRVRDRIMKTLRRTGRGLSHG